ncbi:hypothetical protein BCR43DRAFT_491163 [Syncephalastrum racemosum]|uniref:Uncharacterized protein n=1 Tax=Syncephalastrum racemosum TaxID=13706 RepID=A0A1X2HBI1_SYNRA|nr:hypothetical protein BCR43DRAFT_491163 [Syncephalastrum racemosum]
MSQHQAIEFFSVCMSRKKRAAITKGGIFTFWRWVQARKLPRPISLSWFRLFEGRSQNLYSVRLLCVTLPSSYIVYHFNSSENFFPFVHNNVE